MVDAGQPGGQGGERWRRVRGALAAGDLDGDGYADLAVGAPFESVGGAGSAGAVNVLYGGPTGLTAARDSLWHQDVPGIAEEADPVDFEQYRSGHDQFGAAIAVGDTTGDGRAELVIGAPHESVEREFGSVDGAGAVHVLLGCADGVTAQGSSYWTQDSPGVLDRAERHPDGEGDTLPGDAFGSSLAIGHVDGDGRATLPWASRASSSGTTTSVSSTSPGTERSPSCGARRAV